MPRGWRECSRRRYSCLFSLALGFFVALAGFCFGFGFAFFAGAVGAAMRLLGCFGRNAGVLRSAQNDSFFEGLVFSCRVCPWFVRVVQEGELQATLGTVDAIEEDVDVLADFEDSAVAGAGDGAVGVAEEVPVVL